MNSQDQQYMKGALHLAKKGSNWTFPNPMVGAVLVKNGEIIGTGYHTKFGNPHAEIEAFASAVEDPRGATLYVTLEPCSIHGRTPPCAGAIIAKGIAKVVCAVKDPNPKVNGNGIKLLEEAGIAVVTGVLDQEAQELNEAFFTFHQKKRPFIALKFAASWDGKIATKTGDSKWITNDKAREYARSLRAEYHAILVGINTILHDNPNLGARQKDKRDPLRVILDSTLKMPLTSDVLRNTNVLIITTQRANREAREALEQKGIAVAQLPKEHILVEDIIEVLREKEIVSLFVEGGAEALGSFVDARIVDRIYAFYAPILVGGRNAISAVKGEGVSNITDALRLQKVSYKMLDDNLLLTGTV